MLKFTSLASPPFALPSEQSRSSPVRPPLSTNREEMESRRVQAVAMLQDGKSTGAVAREFAELVKAGRA